MSDTKKVLTPGSADLQELLALSPLKRLEAIGRIVQESDTIAGVTMSADRIPVDGFKLNFSEREASSRCTWGSKPDGGPRL